MQPKVEVYTDLVPSDDSLEIRVEGAEPPQSRQGEEALTYVAPPVDLAEAIQLWGRSPWLAAVGKLIRDAIAGARIEIIPTAEKPDEGQAERLREWLFRPSIALDGIHELDVHAFLAAAFLYEDQTGNVLVEVLRTGDGGPPVGLALIPPQWAVYRYDQDLTVWVLEVQPPYGGGVVTLLPFGARGAKRTLTPSPFEAGEGVSPELSFVSGAQGEPHEYLHYRRPNPVSSFWGIPDWIEARDAVEVDVAHRRYLRRFFEGDTTPRRILTITQDPAWYQAGVGEGGTWEQVREAARMIRDFMIANRGEASARTLTLALPGGVKLEDLPLAARAEDPTFEKASKDARDAILAVRRVSLVDLGLPEGGYRATAEAQSRSFRDQVLRPAARGVVSLINRLVRAKEPVGLGITDYRVEVVFERPEEVLARIEAVVRATGVPVLSPDEGRELLGYEPVGDRDLWRPASWVAYGPGGEEG